MRTDNPLADFDRHDAECEAELERLPKCDYCGKRIQDDYLYDLEGDIVCENCMKREFRKETESYIK